MARSAGKRPRFTNVPFDAVVARKDKTRDAPPVYQFGNGRRQFRDKLPMYSNSEAPE